jgi:hypothetical protein
MIVILMKYHGHSLQSAIDHVGKLCADTITNFEQSKGCVPSWGPEINDMVKGYIQGLQDWIVGYVKYPKKKKIPFLPHLTFNPPSTDLFTGASKPTDTLAPTA